MWTCLNLNLNELKSGIKNGTEVILKLSSTVIDDCNDETNFPHKLLLNDRQFSRLRAAFANNCEKLFKMVQLGGFKPELDLQKYIWKICEK